MLPAPSPSRSSRRRRAGSHDPPVGPHRRLASDRNAVRHAADENPARRDAELVLVIDQFEESSPSSRRGRAHEVPRRGRRRGDRSRSRVRVVTTLRADFYDRPLRYKGFGELLASRTYAVHRCRRASSRSRCRARRVGRGGRRPGLVGEVVADVAGRPGALPLLQFALTELFEERADSTVTLAYRASRWRVRGAARGAEELYEGSAPTPRDAARAALPPPRRARRGRSQDTRRRAIRSELTSLGVDRRAMDTVIDTLGSRRLLSFDRDPEAGRRRSRSRTRRSSASGAAPRVDRCRA